VHDLGFAFPTTPGDYLVELASGRPPGVSVEDSDVPCQPPSSRRHPLEWSATPGRLTQEANAMTTGYCARSCSPSRTGSGSTVTTNLRVIDCATLECRRAHIPTPWLPVTPHRDRRTAFVPPEAFAELMGKLGVSRRRYDDNSSLVAALVGAQLLRPRDAKVLNGGWHRWLTEGRPVTFHQSRARPAVFPRPDETLICRLNQGEAGRPDVRIMDMRTNEEWLGNDRGNKRTATSPAPSTWWLDYITSDDRRVFKPRRRCAPCSATWASNRAGSRHLLTRRHPCGARTVRPPTAGLGPHPQLHEPRGRVGQPRFPLVLDTTVACNSHKAQSRRLVISSAARKSRDGGSNGDASFGCAQGRRVAQHDMDLGVFALARDIPIGSVATIGNLGMSALLTTARPGSRYHRSKNADAARAPAGDSWRFHAP
jgi:hypothetical protein